MCRYWRIYRFTIVNSLFASSQTPQNSSVLPAHGPKSSGSLEEVVRFGLVP